MFSSYSLGLDSYGAARELPESVKAKADGNSNSSDSSDAWSYKESDFSSMKKMSLQVTL